MSKNFLDQVRSDLAAKIIERAEAFAKMEAATAAATEESRSALTDEETAAFDEARTAVEGLDTEIEALEAREADLVKLAERARAVKDAPFTTIVQKDETPRDERSISLMGRTEARDAAMRIIDRNEKDRTVELDTRQKDRLDALLRTSNGNTEGKHIAERMLLTENDDYRSAFAKVLLGQGAALDADESRALGEFARWESRAAMSSTAAAGGHGVPVLIDPTIVLTTQGHPAVVLQSCRVETITTDEWKGVTSTGTTWSYDEEITEVSEDTPVTAQPTVEVWESRNFVGFSNRIGMDYPNFAAEIGRVIAEGYNDSLAYYTVLGSGSTQPFGIITALDANTNVEVVPTTDGALYGQDIGKVWTNLAERYRGNATWMMSADMAEEIAAFGSADYHAFQTSRLGDEVTQTLRGRPVKYSDYFPSFASSTGAANLLVVGDFRNYLFVQRAGMAMEYVPHTFGTSNPGRPTGERGWFSWARNGGDSINDLGFRLLQNQ